MKRIKLKKLTCYGMVDWLARTDRIIDIREVPKREYEEQYSLLPRMMPHKMVCCIQYQVSRDQIDMHLVRADFGPLSDKVSEVLDETW